MKILSDLFTIFCVPIAIGVAYLLIYGMAGIGIIPGDMPEPVAISTWTAPSKE